MRVLFVIPHYYGVGAAGHGATDQNKREERILAVRTCILSLYQHFSAQQIIVPWGDQPHLPANQALSHEIRVIVCVTGENNLLDHLGIPDNLYTKHSVELDDPLKLGFACYDVMRCARNCYDWYCYLEDDTVITDPLFFHKLQAFYHAANTDRYLLQPNRFEIGSGDTAFKAYTDGPLWDANLMEAFSHSRFPVGVPELNVTCLNTAFRMVLATNPHAGCFFLMESQLHHMMEKPWCGKFDDSFCGPLESAATLYIMAFFHVYKPAPECASFLEVHHWHQRYFPPVMQKL